MHRDDFLSPRTHLRRLVFQIDQHHLSSQRRSNANLTNVIVVVPYCVKTRKRSPHLTGRLFQANVDSLQPPSLNEGFQIAQVVEVERANEHSVPIPELIDPAEHSEQIVNRGDLC